MFNEVCMIQIKMYAVAGNYVLASLTIDRSVALWLPILYKQKSNPQVAIVVTSSIVATLCILCLPVISIYHIRDNECNIFDTSILSHNQIQTYVQCWIRKLESLFFSSKFFSTLDTSQTNMKSGNMVALSFKIKNKV